MANFNGTSGDDIFTGGVDNDTIAGNGGNDTLSGGGGDDRIGGGTGADIIHGDDGNDDLYSFDISPAFNGSPSSSTLLLDTGSEVDWLYGGAGDDRLFAGYGDNVDGGSGLDTLYISVMGASSGVTVDFRQLQNNGSIVVGGGTITNIEGVGWIQGSNFDDDITEGAVTNSGPTYGMGGNDHLVASAGSGAAYGGDGNDVIDRTLAAFGGAVYGEAGDDLIIGGSSGFETLDGGDGNDTIQGNYGYDTLSGGNGNDVLDGGSFGDTLLGDAGNDVLYGAGDADTVNGGAGDDTLYGDYSLIYSGNQLSPQSNDDLLIGGSGADIIHGDEGNDTLWSGDQGTDDAGLEHDQLFGDAGNDTLAIGYGDDADGGSGTDTLRISLAGATSGVTLSTSGFTPGGTWSVNGGTIQNIETLSTITGSGFADNITIATHSFSINVNGGDGDDVITSSASSVIANGGNGNDFFISGTAGDTFDGGAGTDTVDYRNYGVGVTVTLAAVAGQTGSGPGGDQLKNVENVNGTVFDDTLNGSNDANMLGGGSGSDHLNGNGGDDVLDGGFGNDVMSGGAGNDTILVHDVGDQVFEAANEGYDTVLSSVTFTLGAGQYVERMALFGDPSAPLGLTGNELANDLVGNAGANALNGGGGDDILEGGAGADTMTGGLGNDTYYVEDVGDEVVELAGEGNDRIVTSLSYAVSAGQEVEALSAMDLAATTPLNLSGNAGAQTIIGNAGANVLTGGGGADDLVGLGGDDILIGNADAASSLEGGTGDDYYYVNRTGDSVVETAGQGNDRVYASVSFTLSNGQEVETLVTADANATNAINLTGNNLAQFISGNAGANTLVSGGGADYLLGLGGDDILVGNAGAASTLQGGTGNDWYYVYRAGDSVLEFAGEGNDRIMSAVSYTLSAGQEIETLSTIDPTQSTAIDLTGNGLGQIIIGNAGANTLTGGGGADYLLGYGGDDILIGNSDAASTLQGGTGNDTYYVTRTGDSIIEFAGEGSDRLITSVSYTLSAGQEIETVSAADQSGTAALDLTGNDYGQLIFGNNGGNIMSGNGGADQLAGFGGDDILLGGDGDDLLNGGAGHDVLNGGAGNDLFVFADALGGSNVDGIQDFATGSDRILLDHSVFAGLATGGLATSAFVLGTGAGDADDRIIYNQATGELWFDADGNGAAAPVLFATLAPSTSLAAADFAVV
jgi:Ca2+-binding RTX toxin-like protein